METISYPTDTKASKDHLCNFCGYKIQKGVTYIKSTHKFDGDVYDWKAHDYCHKIADTLKMYDHADEGVTMEHFQETIYSEHFDLLVKQFPENELKKYSDIIQQLKSVEFKSMLSFVIRHYNTPR